MNACHYLKWNMIAFPFCYYFQQHRGHSRRLQLYFFWWFSCKIFNLFSCDLCFFFFFSVAAAFPHPRVVDAFCTPFFSSGPQYRDNWDPGTKKPNTSVICAFVAGTRGSLAAQHIFLQTNAALVILYLYNYCKSISPASYHTNTATTGCYCCGLCALTVDLQLGTEVWNKI